MVLFVCLLLRFSFLYVYVWAHTTQGLPAPEIKKTRRDPTSSTSKPKCRTRSPRASTSPHTGGRSGSVYLQERYLLPWSLGVGWTGGKAHPPKKEENAVSSCWKNWMRFFFQAWKMKSCVLQSHVFSETSRLFVVCWARVSALNICHVCTRMSKWKCALRAQSKPHISFLWLLDILSFLLKCTRFLVFANFMWL